mmetsp:Transcript_25863/g.60658  ORF Transcript_25863/g.60658 Transcript_25863/m.60658 type:complete len:250 (+) Transcript_25863:503-1252(+)
MDLRQPFGLPDRLLLRRRTGDRSTRRGLARPDDPDADQASPPVLLLHGVRSVRAVRVATEAPGRRHEPVQAVAGLPRRSALPRPTLRGCPRHDRGGDLRGGTVSQRLPGGGGLLPRMRLQRLLLLRREPTDDQGPAQPRQRPFGEPGEPLRRVLLRPGLAPVHVRDVRVVRKLRDRVVRARLGGCAGVQRRGRSGGEGLLQLRPHLLEGHLVRQDHRDGVRVLADGRRDEGGQAARPATPSAEHGPRRR